MATVYSDNSQVAPHFYKNTGTTTSPTLVEIVPATTSSWTYISAAQVLATYIKYAVDTTASAFTLTLPASGMSVGDWLELYDAQQQWATHNLTINPNGGKINGSTSPLVLAAAARKEVVYVGGASGWSVI